MNRKQRRAAAKAGQTNRTTGPGFATPYVAVAEMSAKARQLRLNGQLAAAEDVCRKILAIDPNHAGSLHILGSIALEAGRPDIAIQWLDKAAAFRDRDAALHNERGLALLALGRVAEAERAFQRAVALAPEDGRSHNNLALALWQQGKRAEAAARFATALKTAPELCDRYGEICDTLFRLNPAIAAAAGRAMDAWPRRLSLAALLGPNDHEAVAGDPLLNCLLVIAPVRSIELERLLTCARNALLLSVTQDETNAAEPPDLAFHCALAQQCFINEYVFAASAEEMAAAGQLRKSLVAALKSGAPVAPALIAAAASYFPLHEIDGAEILLDRGVYPGWPAPLEALLTLQLREPLQERELRASVPAMTAIEDATSLAVQRQYEENPYPRWILPARTEKAALDDFLRKHWPHAPLRRVAHGEGLDVLVAGCGTGKLPIEIAQTYAGARVLAVDLSRTSLAYAQRKSRELGCADITYAQADILTLGAIGRSFDYIDASGVLHHLADPEAGWRVLLSLLRPNGVMRVALYSETGRRHIAAARAFCVERGFRATAEDIRVARQALIDSPLREPLVRIYDFYTTSECRDLLFHVQEQRFSIARIRAFLAQENLNLIGFQISPEVLAQYARRFPHDRGLRDLDNWEQFEREQPETFLSMYQFWVQKAASSL